MKLITRIEIKGFRSILDQKIDEMGSFTCLVGANNSGKSNVLRALSLFLSDEPEPKVELDISRDYYKDPQRRKKERLVSRLILAFQITSDLEKELNISRTYWEENSLFVVHGEHTQK